MSSQIYDPLYADTLAPNLPSAPSYWHSTADAIQYPQLTSSKQTDVAIIGGGYTGLSCAIHLARLGVKDITVLEANHIGWGCSSRNAGFVLPGSGRIGYRDLVKRFGKESTLGLHDNYIQAIDLIRELISDNELNVDQTEDGYLKLAHSQNWFGKLQSNADYLQSQFGYEVEVLSKTQLSEQHVQHNKAYGAIRYSNGFGVNPLKLVNGYAQLAHNSGVNIFCNTPAQRFAKNGSQHLIETEQGDLLADKIVFATNGYTPAKLKTPLQGKTLPVLTAVIVTRPLTEEELQASHFKTHQVMMDTRELKYYYRLLPDNRILFGGRGAISGRQADSHKYPNRLLAELKASFPGLNKVSIDFNWHGWIAVSLDQMPHLYKSKQQEYYATGYCGSGLSFSAFAGKQLADLVTEQPLNTPLLSELPTFPFAKFGSLRRIGQGAFYQYGRFKDWMG